MKIEQRIYNGNRAKEILDNEVFLSVFDDIEMELIEAWKKSPQRDEAGREKIHLTVTLLGKVKASLQTTLETGKLAMQELDFQEKQSLAQKFMTGLRSKP